MSTFLLYGVANVGTGFALLFNPNALYQSFIARFVHQKTGLVSTLHKMAHPTINILTELNLNLMWFFRST